MLMAWHFSYHISASLQTGSPIEDMCVNPAQSMDPHQESPWLQWLSLLSCPSSGQWCSSVLNDEFITVRWSAATQCTGTCSKLQLRWSGHVTCMDDSRLPKQLFHAELSTGKGHKGGQRKRYKDVLKSTLKAYNIPVDEWQALAQDRLAWRAAIREGTKHFEKSQLQSLDDKRSARKNRVPNPSTAVPCQLCGKICASTFGLQAHMRKHQHWRVIFEIEGLLLHVASWYSAYTHMTHIVIPS